jgi:uncharacterized protein YfbU (UPF0304 family)
MGMYWRLQSDNNALAAKDRIDPEKLLFYGFDGNEEVELMGFAKYLKTDTRFNSLQVWAEDFNSHFPTTHRYTKMLERWDQLDHTKKLTADEIKRMID